jgi:hypothetical protein
MKKILLIVGVLFAANVFARGGGHGGGHSSGHGSSTGHSSSHGVGEVHSSYSSAPLTFHGTPVNVFSSSSSCSDSPKWYEFTKKRCTNNK